MYMSYYAMLRRHRPDGKQYISRPVSIMRWTPKWYDDLHLPVFKLLAPAEDHEYKGWDDFVQNYSNSVLYPLEKYRYNAFKGQKAVALELIKTLYGENEANSCAGLTDINRILSDVVLLGYEETERQNERWLIGPWFEKEGIICKEWNKVDEI